MSSDLSGQLPFLIRKGNIYALPTLHYTMEFAVAAREAFFALKPDCVAVELPETMQLQMLHAASRLPDISIVVTENAAHAPLYFLAEPCDASFEALRSALEAGIPAACIDLDIEEYPDHHDFLPDAYAIRRIGLNAYYQAYKRNVLDKGLCPFSAHDEARETYMARRLKELSLSHEKILFVGGLVHIERVLAKVDLNVFPKQSHVARNTIQLCTLTEMSSRDAMAETGWVSTHYEGWREMTAASVKDTDREDLLPPDRQKLIYSLLKEASSIYTENTGNAFPGYHMRNLMKFLRNYALTTGHLMPDLFQILSAAKGCVDHNYAYETWVLATSYPYRRNVDNLPELDLSIEEIWGRSKKIRFHMQTKNPKSSFAPRLRKDHSKARFRPPGPFTICSWQPEDTVIERFGEFLKKKGTQLIQEESARTVPFSTSLEDGIDTKETIRHWHEKKLYVKTSGKPPGGVGSVVVIFDPDTPAEGEQYKDKYPWRTTWIGEHSQESDMAFYATPVTDNVVGPGISRCEYGGFMMSYPPRRLIDVWGDPDYVECRTKAEALLMAAIDYSSKPLITYVAASPPRSALKNYARRFGKKVVYFPIGQLSPVTLNKLRVFHVLDGKDKREIAGEFIF